MAHSETVAAAQAQVVVVPSGQGASMKLTTGVRLPRRLMGLGIRTLTMRT
jgi:hypothetical protein